MDIILEGAACIAVNQGTMYAAIKGTQLGGDVGDILVLIKSEYPTTVVANNIWSAISTAPAGYFSLTSDMITNTSCNVDKSGVFTLRFFDGSGYRYDPTAPKSSKTQTCSSDGNRLGEWKKADLVNPIEPGLVKPVFIQPEIVGSSSDNGGYSEGDQIAIYQKGFSQELPATFLYGRIDKDAYVNTITGKDLSQVSIGEKDMRFDSLAYGDGQMYSVFSSRTQISVQTGFAINTTLAYYPFEAPFQLTSPPNSAVYVPWIVDCDASDPFYLSMAAKGKFYYMCTVPGSLPFNDKIIMYIFDSKSRQTQGPFTLPNITGIPYVNNRLLPVYSATDQNEPRFLVVNLFPLQKVPGAIDLHALGSNSSQAWTNFSLPARLQVEEGLEPSCRTRKGAERLVTAAILSGVFVLFVAFSLLIRLKRKRRSNRSADKTSLGVDLKPEFLNTAAQGHRYTKEGFPSVAARE